ncbi:SDR family NAD(P)-dependent oxidoreductase [Rhodococcus erythropolis]|uniref:SDR family NAD(P)-dependent oxidoreductase n=1 Tax=Rhodococcus erythropolis TaxID=1833 RepID=UPI0037A6BDBC
MNRLADKVAIVTGASPNIGGTLAMGLAAEGARVLCTDLSPSVAEDCAAKIVAQGGEAIAIAGDVTDPAHADEAAAAAVDRWGKIDLLVNNAVFFQQQGVLTMPYEDFRRQLDVILGGSFLFTRAVARTMIETGTAGSIVNVLSTAAWQGQPGNIGYSTGKSGLVNFTRSGVCNMDTSIARPLRAKRRQRTQPLWSRVLRPARCELPSNVQRMRLDRQQRHQISQCRRVDANTRISIGKGAGPFAAVGEGPLEVLSGFVSKNACCHQRRRHHNESPLA